MAALGLAVMLGCASGAQARSLAMRLPVHYRVLSASFTTHFNASQAGGECASFGGTSGWETDAGTLTGASQLDPNSVLQAEYPGGPLIGGMVAKVPWDDSGRISGCDTSPDQKLESCVRSWSHVRLPNLTTIGFSILVPKPASGQASVHWQLSGYGMAGTNDCNVQIWVSIPYATSDQTVPLAKLLASGQQTFTFNGSIHLDHDMFGKPASIDFNWRYSITVQIYKSGCPAPNVKTGRGYEGLSAVMKSRLGTLYSILEGENACYHFNIGFRSETVQKDLYDRWHKIADGHKNDKQLCNKLKAAGFAQCPTRWRPNGTARGGPAKPGTSRHEAAQAADITVTFPPTYKPNLAKYRAASHQAGLCGPPPKDPVHVELPYKKPGQTKAQCNFD